MTIRPAKFGDIPELVELLVNAQKKSIYAGGPEIDEAYTKTLFAQCLQRNGHTNDGGTWFLVAETNGEVCGLIIGVIQRIYNVGKKFEVSDLIWYADSERCDPRDARKLVRSVVRFGRKNPNVVDVKIGATGAIFDDPEQVSRVGNILIHMGFKPFGNFYRMEV